MPFFGVQPDNVSEVIKKTQFYKLLVFEYETCTLHVPNREYLDFGLIMSAITCLLARVFISISHDFCRHGSTAPELHLTKQFLCSCPTVVLGVHFCVLVSLFLKLAPIYPALSRLDHLEKSDSPVYIPWVAGVGFLDMHRKNRCSLINGVSAKAW